jgi:hypothetical protein
MDMLLELLLLVHDLVLVMLILVLELIFHGMFLRGTQRLQF